MARAVPEDSGPLVGVRVHVYRNLHRPGVTWSVRAGGRVVAHVRDLTVADVAFRVQPAGQRRARASGQRNVHAYVVGTVTPTVDGRCWREGRYDPFRTDTFVDDTGSPLHTAALARFDGHGLWWCAGDRPVI